jgi:CrcB protein
MAVAGDGDMPGVPLDPDIDSGSDDGVGSHSRRKRPRQAQTIIVVALGLGGVLGAVSRYAVSLALPTAPGRFPWGTFLINVSGSALLGFILVLLIEQFPRGRLARPMIGTGFIGAYTTFSTFMVETAELIRDGRPDTAIAFLAASVLAGLSAVWIGMTSARVVLRAEHWLQQEA